MPVTAVDLLRGFGQKQGCWQDEHPASSPLVFSTLQRTGPLTQRSAEVSCPLWDLVKFHSLWGIGPPAFSRFSLSPPMGYSRANLCCQKTQLDSSKESALVSGFISIFILLFEALCWWATGRGLLAEHLAVYVLLALSLPFFLPFSSLVRDSPFSWTWMSPLAELFEILASTKSSLPRNFFWTAALFSQWDLGKFYLLNFFRVFRVFRVKWLGMQAEDLSELQQGRLNLTYWLWSTHHKLVQSGSHPYPFPRGENK